MAKQNKYMAIKTHELPTYDLLMAHCLHRTTGVKNGVAKVTRITSSETVYTRVWMRWCILEAISGVESMLWRGYYN